MGKIYGEFNRFKKNQLIKETIFNGNNLENLSRTFLLNNFSDKNELFDLTVLKEKMYEFDYLIKKQYIIERGDTVGTLHYEISQEGKRFMLEDKRLH